MKPIFIADYFKLDGESVSAELAAYRANCKIESLLGPVVYGSHSWVMDMGGPNEKRSDSLVWDEHKGNHPVYSAHLFNIQELPKKECEHVPQETTVTYYSIGGVISTPLPLTPSVLCAKCGIKLKARWEAEK